MNVPDVPLELRDVVRTTSSTRRDGGTAPIEPRPAQSPETPRVRGISVLVADDHAPMRAALRTVLERGGYDVCAEARDADSAVEASLRLRPDIALIDIHMPGSGIEATARIAAELPSTTIVVLTVSRDESDLFDALQAGAVGYLLKGGRLDDLPQLLERVLAGEALLSGRLVARVLAEFRDRGSARRAFQSKIAGAELTRREWDVLELLARDLSTAEIAGQLFIQEVTVRTHVASILRKLRVPSREAATSLFRGRFGRRSIH